MKHNNIKHRPLRLVVPPGAVATSAPLHTFEFSVCFLSLVCENFPCFLRILVMNLKDIQYIGLDIFGVFSEGISWVSSPLFWQKCKSGTWAEDSIVDAGIFEDQANYLQMCFGCSYMKIKSTGF